MKKPKLHLLLHKIKNKFLLQIVDFPSLFCLVSMKQSFVYYNVYRDIYKKQ